MHGNATNLGHRTIRFFYMGIDLNSNISFVLMCKGSIVLYCIACIDCIALYGMVLHCIALHCIAVQCSALHYITLHCIVWYCMVLYYIALHGMALYCSIVLHCMVFILISLLLLLLFLFVRIAVIFVWWERCSLTWVVRQQGLLGQGRQKPLRWVSTRCWFLTGHQWTGRVSKTIGEAGKERAPRMQRRLWREARIKRGSGRVL